MCVYLHIYERCVIFEDIFGALDGFGCHLKSPIYLLHYVS